MFSITVVVFISFCAVEIFAVHGSCATPNNGSLIENCCDLMKSEEIAFVTWHEKTGLMYTKYTYSYYSMYLLYCLRF